MSVIGRPEDATPSVQHEGAPATAAATAAAPVVDVPGCQCTNSAGRSSRIACPDIPQMS